MSNNNNDYKEEEAVVKLTELELLKLVDGDPSDYAYLLGRRLMSTDLAVRAAALKEPDELIAFEEDPNT